MVESILGEPTNTVGIQTLSIIVFLSLRYLYWALQWCTTAGLADCLTAASMTRSPGNYVPSFKQVALLQLSCELKLSTDQVQQILG